MIENKSSFNFSFFSFRFQRHQHEPAVSHRRAGPDRQPFVRMERSSETSRNLPKPQVPQPLKQPLVRQAQPLEGRDLGAVAPAAPEVGPERKQTRLEID